MIEKITHKINTLDKALHGLEYMLSKGMDKDRAYIDSSIQRFEITFELFWQTLKIILAYQGIKADFPRDALKKSYQGNLIHHEKVWIKMMEDRNKTSHVYDEKKADAIYTRIKSYAPLMRETFQMLNTFF